MPPKWKKPRGKQGAHPAGQTGKVPKWRVKNSSKSPLDKAPLIDIKHTQYSWVQSNSLFEVHPVPTGVSCVEAVTNILLKEGVHAKETLGPTATVVEMHNAFPYVDIWQIVPHRADRRWLWQRSKGAGNGCSQLVFVPVDNTGKIAPHWCVTSYVHAPFEEARMKRWQRVSNALQEIWQVDDAGDDAPVQPVEAPCLDFAVEDLRNLFEDETTNNLKQVVESPAEQKCAPREEPVKYVKRDGGYVSGGQVDDFSEYQPPPPLTSDNALVPYKWEAPGPNRRVKIVISDFVPIGNVVWRPVDLKNYACTCDTFTGTVCTCIHFPLCNHGTLTPVFFATPTAFQVFCYLFYHRRTTLDVRRLHSNFFGPTRTPINFNQTVVSGNGGMRVEVTAGGAITKHYSVSRFFDPRHWKKRTLVAGVAICLGASNLLLRHGVTRCLAPFVCKLTLAFGAIFGWVCETVKNACVGLQPRVTRCSETIASTQPTLSLAGSRLGFLDTTEYVDPNPEIELPLDYPTTFINEVITRATVLQITDEKALRKMISLHAAKNRFADPVTPQTMDKIVKTISRVNSLPGAAVLKHSFSQPCMFCDRPFGKTRFKHRLCPEHYKIIFDNHAPPFSTPAAFGVISGLPVRDQNIGPVVYTTRDFDLPTLQTFPLEKLFSKPDLVQHYLDKPIVTPKKTTVLVGFGVAGAPVMSAAKGITTGAKAVLCRVGRVPKFRPKYFAFRIMLRWYREHVQQEPVEAMDREVWLTTVRRVEDMREAIAELEFGRPDDWGKPRWKAFVKNEKSCASSYDDVVDGMLPVLTFKPRLIQAPPDWVHVLLGPTVKTVLGEFARTFHEDSPMFYAGCAKPATLNKWLNSIHGDHWFVSIDYKMFDCTHSDESLRFALEVYQLFVHFTEEAKDVYKMIKRPKGYCGDIAYTAPKAMNGSGRPDTSLVNIVNSFAALAFMVAALTTGKDHKAITVDDINESLATVKIAGSGDDSLIMLPKTGRLTAGVDTEEITAAIGAFGFDAPSDKISVTTFEDIVFLGHCPYPVGGAWYWGPVLGRRLYKHHVMLNPRGDLRAWLHGVAEAEQLCYAHVPILADQAAVALKQLRKHKKNPYVDEDARYKPIFCDGTTPKYDEGTLQHCDTMYGLPQGSFKEFIETLQDYSLPAVIDHFVLDAILARDEL